MGPASKGIPKEILGKRCKRFGPIQLTWSQPTAILAAMIIQILLSMWRVCSTSPIWFSSEDGSWKKFAKAVFLGRPKASFGFMHITCSSCTRWYKYNSDSEFKFSNLFKSRLQAQQHGSIIEKLRHQVIFVLSDAGRGRAETELQA